MESPRIYRAWMELGLQYVCDHYKVINNSHNKTDTTAVYQTRLFHTVNCQLPTEPCKIPKLRHAVGVGNSYCNMLQCYIKISLTNYTVISAHLVSSINDPTATLPNPPLGFYQLASSTKLTGSECHTSGGR